MTTFEQNKQKARDALDALGLGFQDVEKHADAIALDIEVAQNARKTATMFAGVMRHFDREFRAVSKDED